MTSNADNTLRKYTTAVSKGAGMIDETRRLLRQWRPDETLDDFARRVQDEGLLGNATAYRTRDVVRRVFAPRFLRPTDKPVRVLQKVLEADMPAATFSELVFLYTCRFDPLIYDFTVREYWPAVRKRKTVLETYTAVAFLTEAAIDGRLDAQWSDKVSLRIGRAVLGVLKDVGLLRETTRGRREIVQYRMTDEGVAILALDLHESGVTDSSLHLHPDWGLFGMGGPEVLDRLDRLGEQRGLIVQRAGAVVGITWFIDSMEELINVLTR